MSSGESRNIWIVGILIAGLIIGHIIWVDAATARKTVAFDEIDVQRINVREPDGTVRMVIANSSALPGAFFKGREITRPEPRGAGMIFLNDEGTENGGLVFDGRKTDGRVSQSGHLSFDQYEQDQVISLDQGESNGRRHATLSFNDMPDTPLPYDSFPRKDTPEVQAELQKMLAAGAFGAERVKLGKTTDRSSVLELKDAKGRPRLVLKVAADGAATIDFVDEAGKVVRTLTPTR
jgi:hypothetical protein